MLLPGIRPFPLSAGVLLLGALLTAVPSASQQTSPGASHIPAENQFGGWKFLSSADGRSPKPVFSAPSYMRGYSFVRPVKSAPAFLKPVPAWSPGMIERMEGAFSCNDTPFVDQVRLPVATLWRGRLKLTGFESDVTTANFVLGLPGAGTLPNLSLMGSGHLAVHAPPSDQLVGMHVTFYMRGGETDAQDSSGLRGMQYLARTGREFLRAFLDR